jgi:hypothetical protein
MVDDVVRVFRLLSKAPLRVRFRGCRHVKLLRAVIREDLSFGMVDALLNDIKRALDWVRGLMYPCRGIHGAAGQWI